jgi:allantoin racemase
VVGIAEAAMLAAAAIGRFSVVTTTPELAASIAKLAGTYGCAERFCSVRLTPGDPVKVMADPQRLVAALWLACQEAIRQDGAEAIVIGGGPLAVAARALRSQISLPMIEPVPCAVARVLNLISRQ